LELYIIYIRIIYKWKNRKIYLINISLFNEINFENEINFKDLFQYDSKSFNDDWKISQESWLILKWFMSMKIDTDFLIKKEK